MSTPLSHNRRSGPRRSPPAMSFLQKSDTFSARTGLRSDLYDPLENSSFSNKRSSTSLDDFFLQDRADLQATRQERVAKYLKDVDETIQGNSPDAGLSMLNNQQVYAASTIVTSAIVPGPMAIDEKKASLPEPDHHHDSDSGLGSSIDTPQQDTRSLSSTLSSSRTSRSAITSSYSSESHNPQNKAKLSTEAEKQIRERILQPILEDESLQDFHPLINSIPSQVSAKFIASLRDLEKTLLYETPVSLRTYLSACAVAYYSGRDVKRFSSSASSFIKFWEFSIDCLHTTVDFLKDADQRRPSDRPYTNNYFLDLVDQIRRYAEIMRRTREKQENGEELDEMDFSPYVSSTPVTSPHSLNQMTHVSQSSHRDLLALYHTLFPQSPCNRMARGTTCLHTLSDEQVTIRGGLSSNGRPAELVRQKDGKSIPLISDEHRDGLDDTMSLKRYHDDDDSDDDDVLRSMARRRKSDKAGDVMHVCSCCKKEFKRPCDLTKHEKTHSRPFKCSEPSCRYHDLGWPTEKERDRHVNDKHSSAPKMYSCKFPPCSYSSKRESNCKQHMEKAHNWTYVRSKSNGRKKGDGSVSVATPSTPMTPLDATPTSGYTPGSNFAQSPWWPTDNGAGYPDQAMQGFETYGSTNRRDSITTAATNFTLSSGFSPEQFQASMNTAPPSENMGLSPDLFTNAGMDMDYGTLDSITYQQPTPALSVNDFGFNLNSFQAIEGAQNSYPQQPQQISPSGAGDMTLYSPEEAIQDEGFGDNFNLNDDFLLFPAASTSGAMMGSATSNWFPDINGANDQFDPLQYDSGSMFNQ
ncbi:hypothetical protein BT63DRAFT_15980 [Microthyrium microscopicum]|uniref:C2H2-type domain-containing protein n=1 Tax=Microthyrium microscopicum TaxID=703497 RepID=A0A6A6UQS9_9PEZI|nr:hypothetical protein BT63DRAFT_15980 [Microthyrium microscopicum]